MLYRVAEEDDASLQVTPPNIYSELLCCECITKKYLTPKHNIFSRD